MTAKLTLLSEVPHPVAKFMDAAHAPALELDPTAIAVGWIAATQVNYQVQIM